MTPSTRPVMAWHFLKADKMTQYANPRKIRRGLTLRVDPDELELCNYGLHASVNPLDALRYAPGPIVCRVRLSGRIIHGDDKLCASERTVVAMGDATDAPRLFARRCALDVIHLWDAPAVVVAYLKTGDESLRDAARDAAWDAQTRRLTRLLNGVVS